MTPRTRRTALPTLVAALALSSARCKAEDPTELVIVISTNLRPGADLRGVTLMAEREGAATPVLAPRRYAIARVDGGAPAGGIDAGVMLFRMPGEVSIVAADPNDTRPLHISAEADLGSPDDNFTQEAIVHFRPHELVYLDMFLPQRCGFPVNRLCGQGYVCGATGCEPIVRDPPLSTRPTPRDVPLVDAPLVDATPPDDLTDAAVPSDIATDIATDAPADAPPDVACPALMVAPRLIAPLSGSVISTDAEILEWTLPAGAGYTEFDICDDRDCRTVHTRNPGTPASGPGRPVTGLGTLNFPPGTYYWRARGLYGTCAGPHSPIWEMVFPPRPLLSDAGPPRANTYWGATPDFNRDGFADLIIGTPALLGSTVPGRVDVYAGSATGIATPASPTLTLAPPADLTGTMGSTFGVSVAGAGDVNGDGYPDAVVGARANRVYVYLGGPTGLDPAPAATLANAALLGFGGLAVGVGDVDHDGYGDLAATASDARTVVVYYGAPDLAAMRSTAFPLADGVHAFGSTVAAAGDLDGDRYADVVVGAPGLAGSLGQAYVLWGGPDGASAPVALDAPAALATQGFGAAVAGGDVNGDGYADLAVGDPVGGRVLFFRGGVSRALEYMGRTNVALAAVPRFGTVLACAGDLDGDTFADFLVGAPQANQAHVLFGHGDAGFVVESTPFATGLVGSYYGAAVAGFGDLDNDGRSDAVVSAAHFSDPTLSSVTVYRTRSPADWHTPTVTAFPITIPGPMPRVSSFGRSLGVGR